MTADATAAGTAANRQRYTSHHILGLNALQRLTRRHGLTLAGAPT